MSASAAVATGPEPTPARAAAGVPAPFGALVRAAVRDVEVATGHRVEAIVTPGVPAVPEADVHLRILRTLLDGAVRSGPVDPPVRVLATHHGHEVVVEVVGHGGGTTARGLSFVRGLVEGVGGALSVTSAPDGGTWVGYVAPAARGPGPTGHRRQSRGSGS